MCFCNIYTLTACPKLHKIKCYYRLCSMHMRLLPPFSPPSSPSSSPRKLRTTPSYEHLVEALNPVGTCPRVPGFLLPEEKVAYLHCIETIVPYPSPPQEVRLAKAGCGLSGCRAPDTVGVEGAWVGLAEVTCCHAESVGAHELEEASGVDIWDLDAAERRRRGKHWGGGCTCDSNVEGKSAQASSWYEDSNGRPAIEPLAVNLPGISTWRAVLILHSPKPLLQLLHNPPVASLPLRPPFITPITVKLLKRAPHLVQIPVARTTPPSLESTTGSLEIGSERIHRRTEYGLAEDRIVFDCAVDLIQGTEVIDGRLVEERLVREGEGEEGSSAMVG
ncbi:hypothetical protein C7212DRAFT_348457 [Tuber magnatum]|uniref:Uncharacterized protein n=1 Tax=Tuber magnatum TaxID=42249 RepID=A0A317SBJ8_9PEZI|nr:hypothetical protein C7212DRAFT_348457 [Tuber magnatum]